MELCCSKPADIGDGAFKRDYEHLSPNQKDKLNSRLKEIVTKASVDFSNPEIQDIQSAVSEMLERIKTRINERGVFSISRLEPCGSMAEKTAMWKYDYGRQPFIEFDFLAVLQAACNFKTGCSECCYVKTPPMNLEKREKYYGSLDRDSSTLFSFIRETNECLASCKCLEVKYLVDQRWLMYTFKRASTCSDNQQGCDKCTVDRPTGTLGVKTSVKIGHTWKQCSLIFVWTSKAKILCTCDHHWLPQTEKMDNLTIDIDFLPALELFQSKQQSADVTACSSSGLVLNPTSSEYVHYCFLVPKSFVVCRGGWRRSGCLAEIDTFVNKMSDKHRKCFKVMKYFSMKKRFMLKNYHIKIALLHHNSSCSDAGEDCAKCVFKRLDTFQHAYNAGQLKSLHSQANLLNKELRYYGDSEAISRLREAMCSAVSESDSVSSFLDNIDELYSRIWKDK